MRKSIPEDAAVSSRSRLSQFLSTNGAFIVVWLAMFIAVIGIAMVSPLLPVFAEEMGASGIWLGLAFSGFALSQIPLTPVVGRLADRFNKKFFLWLGLLIYAMASVGYFWAPGYQELVLFRVFSGIGAAMVIPIAFSYVAELTPYGHEGRYMGLFNIALIAGFGIGPVFGGLIHDSLGTDATFASMGMLSMLGSAIIILFLPKSAASSGVTEFEEPSNSFAAMFRDATMRGILTLQMVLGLLFGTALTFIGIWMTRVIDTSVAQVGIVLAGRAIMNGTLTYPFGWLADRVNRVTLASAGIVMVAVSTFSIPWFGSFAPLLGLFMITGIFESMAMPSITAIAVERGRRMGMGSVMGVFNMAMSLGLVIGSLSGGMIESSLGIVAVFRYIAVLGLAGVVIFNVLMPRNNRLPEEPFSVVHPDAPDSASNGSADTPDK